MSDFPFDGLDLEPTPVQAALIADARELFERPGIREPDVIQPRPTNPGAIELFWVEEKLCVVIESEAQIESVARLAPPRAA